MSNLEKAAAGVPFVLDGKEKKLVFNLRAAMLLEKETGKSMINGEMLRDPRLTDLVVMIWAMLQNGDAKGRPTLDYVTDSLSFEDMPRLTKAIQEAFGQATPAETKNAVTVEPLPA